MRYSFTWVGGSLSVLALICSSAKAATVDDSTPEWKVSTGAAAVWQPEVEGGKYYRFRGVPLLSIEHRDGWFLDLQEGLGKKWQLTPTTTIALFLAASNWRNNSDKIDNHISLSGMGDIDMVAQAGFALTYRYNDWKLSARYLGNLKRSQKGQQLVLGADYTVLRSPSAILMLNSSLIAGDDQDMQRWFGVSSEQAAKSGFNVYQAKGGWRQGMLGTTLILPLDKHWQALGRVSYMRMLGSSTDSPLVKTHGYGTVGAGAQYTW